MIVLAWLEMLHITCAATLLESLLPIRSGKCRIYTFNQMSCLSMSPTQYAYMHRYTFLVIVLWRGEICLPVCWESEKKRRNLKDGTLYIRFLVLLLALTNENAEANARTHTYILEYIEQKREMLWWNTFSQHHHPRPTNDYALTSRKKRNREEHENWRRK